MATDTDWADWAIAQMFSHLDANRTGVITGATMQTFLTCTKLDYKAYIIIHIYFQILQ